MGLREILSPKEWMSGWRADYAEFSWWRRGLLRLAVIALIAGIGVRTVFGGWSETFSPTESNDRASVEPRSAFVDGGAPLPAPETSDADDDARTWSGVSGFLMKCGLSFLVAFFVAYMLRKAVRVGMIVLLAVAGGLLTLNMLGILDLPFDTWSADLKALAGTLEGRGSELMELIKGGLPSSVTAGAGLFSGFKRG